MFAWAVRQQHSLLRLEGTQHVGWAVRQQHCLMRHYETQHASRTCERQGCDCIAGRGAGEAAAGGEVQGSASQLGTAAAAQQQPAGIHCQSTAGPAGFKLKGGPPLQSTCNDTHVHVTADA